jgi:hypothetical protein
VATGTPPYSNDGIVRLAIAATSIYGGALRPLLRGLEGME